MKYFDLDLVPGTNNYGICINIYDLPFPNGLTYGGSLNVIMARLLGLTWVDFLKYCRDELNATIVGRNSLYPSIYFKKDKKTIEFIDELNNKVKKIKEKYYGI